LWQKSAFCGEKVKNAGKKKLIYVYTSGLVTTISAPAFRAFKILFLRRRAHSADPILVHANQMMHACTFHILGAFPQPHLCSAGLLVLLNLVRKPSTLNGHAPSFQKWQTLCHDLGLSYLPAAPLAVAECARTNRLPLLPPQHIGPPETSLGAGPRATQDCDDCHHSLPASCAVPLSDLSRHFALGNTSWPRLWL
jgi:hypothetical protein